MNEAHKEKFAKLRQKYTGDFNAREISQMEQELTRLLEAKKMVQDPTFQAIMKDAQRRVTEINVLLMNDEKLTSEQRAALFHERTVWQFVFDRFGMTMENEAVAQLENIIDTKLNE